MRVNLKLRQSSREGYVEVELTGNVNMADMKPETALRITQMLWEAERAINDPGKVRCHFELSEE